MYQRLYKQDIELLTLFADYKQITSKVLARTRRVSKRTATRQLSKLESMGLLSATPRPKHSPVRIYMIPSVKRRNAKALFKQIVIMLKRLGGKFWVRIPPLIQLRIIMLQRLSKDVKRRFQRLGNGSLSNLGMAGVRGAVCEPKGGRGI